MARVPTPERSQPVSDGINNKQNRNKRQYGIALGLEIEMDMEKKEKEREPPSAKDNLVCSKRERLGKDGLRPRRYSTLATRVTFTDLVVRRLRYISPRQSHYSGSRRLI